MKRFLMFIPLLLAAVSAFTQVDVNAQKKKIEWLLSQSESYSVDAQAVFTNMPDALTISDKNAIADFVDGQVIAGNWDNIIDFVRFDLNTINNSQAGWKGVIDATIVNCDWFKYDAVQSRGVTGSYVRTGIIPSVIGSLNNFGIGATIKEMRGTNAVLLGALQAAASERQFLLSETTGTLVRYLVNSTTSVTTTASLGFLDYSNYSADRTGAALQRVIKDGVSLATNTNASGGLSQIEVYMFARNNDGVAALENEGRSRGYWVYNPVGFDIAAWNTGIVALNTAIDNNIDYLAVVIQAGQSNEAGRGENNRRRALTSYTVDRVTGMKIYYKTTSDLTDNGKSVQYNSGSNSVEPANEAALDCFGKEVSLGTLFYSNKGWGLNTIKAAIGGTALNINASPNWSPAEASKEFRKMVDAYQNPFFTKLEIEYPGKLIKPIMLWHQGEQDATNGTFTTNYSTNFTTFVTAWRASNANLATAPLFITLLQYARSANEKTINEVFVNYANNNDNVYIINVTEDPAAYLATLSVQPTAGKCFNGTVISARKQDLPADVKATYPPTASPDDTHQTYEFQIKAGEVIWDACVFIGYYN